MIRQAFRLAVAALALSPSWASALEVPALNELRAVAAGAPTTPPPPAPQAAEPAKIDWQDAAAHVGESVSVEGKLIHAYANEKVCFLNFGDYKTTLTLVIFASSFKDFPAGPQFFYQDKTIRATGQIQKSPWGTLQIVLKSADQIVVTSKDALKVLDWEDVTAAYENQVVTVEGVIQAATKSAKVGYLNFHPNWSRYVAGTIFATVFPHFPADLAAAYEGKKVQLTGMVKVYQGRPEILLYSAAQVKVLGGEAAKVYRIALAKEKIGFDDGDSIFYEFTPAESPDGQPFKGGLRLLGFDTPEIMHPEDGIFYDQPRGSDAADLARAAFKSAKKIEFVTHGERDKYGRMLGHLILDGEPLGVLQLRAGLAYEMVSNFGDNGFPDLAAKMWDAWSKGPIAAALADGRKPPFIRPGDWRRLNQIHELAMPRDTWTAMSRADKKAFLVKVKQIVDQRRHAMSGGDQPAQ